MEASFEDFVLTRGKALLRFAVMLCGDRGRAEDLVQSTLLAAYRWWAQLSTMEHPEAYVRTVLVRAHLRWWRRRSSTEIPMQVREDERPDRKDPAGEQASRDAAWELLGRLPPRHRALAGRPCAGRPARHRFHYRPGGVAMTDHDVDSEPVERVLRDTFRRHEYLADGGAQRLLPTVRAGIEERAARRRTVVPRWVPVVAAVVLAAGAVPAALALVRRGGGEPASIGNSPSASAPGASTPAPSPAGGPIGAPPRGYRWESSLGLVAAVPDGWSVNDFGCNMTSAPSVVRGRGPATLCLTMEAPTKEVAIFEHLDQYMTVDGVVAQALLDPGAPREQVRIDGLPAQRLTARLGDGRFAAVVLIPDRGAALVVRTLAQATTDTILASLRVVDVDEVGCPYRRPDVSPMARPGSDLVDAHPVAISICTYESRYWPQGTPEGFGDLGASGELTGEAASHLASLIDRAPAGGNPDVPANQCQPGPALPDAVLRISSADGTVRLVWAWWSDCVHRGLSDGVDTVAMSRSIVAAIANPLGVSYSFNGDLPQ
ncbi:MAG TPA: sigma factor [Micromonosporaceae bacterium]